MRVVLYLISIPSNGPALRDPLVRLTKKRKEGCSTRSPASLYHEAKAVSSTHPINKKGNGGNVLTSMATIFVSPSSIVQPNPSLFPFRLTYLEWNDGLASTYDTDTDIHTKSSYPTSDAFEDGGSSTTSGSPFGSPPR